MASENVAVNVGELGNITLTPVIWDGHGLYVRKCIVPLELDALQLPECMKERTHCVEVIAKGRNVGRPCRKAHQKDFKRARCLADEIQVHDVLIIPNEHHGLKNSRICKYEYFIEESVPHVIYRKDEADG